MLSYLQELITAQPIKPKILVVDDQPINIRVVRDLFKSEYDIYFATDGMSALKVCTKLVPDLILLDVIMPEVDGYDVCKTLKNNPDTATIPIIFVTAKREETDEVVGLEMGAVDFISKPINPTILKARVATHLAIKIQADLLRSQALVDGLTGIANRRKFDESLTRGWFQCLRDQQPISLMMLDVDHFKNYNDYYGHQAGDEVLKKIACTLNSKLKRPFDLVARYGGEEFVVFLPNTDHEGALQLAQQMEKAILDLAIPHAKSETINMITVSMGVTTTIPQRNDRADAVIKATDDLLYLAKSKGRAQMVSAKLY